MMYHRKFQLRRWSPSTQIIIINLFTVFVCSYTYIRRFVIIWVMNLICIVIWWVEIELNNLGILLVEDFVHFLDA